MEELEEKLLKSQFNLLKSQFEIASHEYPELVEKHKEQFNEIIHAIKEKYPDVIDDTNAWLL